MSRRVTRLLSFFYRYYKQNGIITLFFPLFEKRRLVNTQKPLIQRNHQTLQNKDCKDSVSGLYPSNGCYSCSQGTEHMGKGRPLPTSSPGPQNSTFHKFFLHILLYGPHENQALWNIPFLYKKSHGQMFPVDML